MVDIIIIINILLSLNEYLTMFTEVKTEYWSE